MYATYVRSNSGMYSVGVSDTPYKTCPQVDITDLWPANNELTVNIIQKICERVEPLIDD